MTFLRTLLILLVLANLLFLLAGPALFGGSNRGEPGRLANQIDPQKLRVLGSGELPAVTSGVAAESRAPEEKVAEDKGQAPAQPERCVAIAGLSAAQVAALKSKLGTEDVVKLRERTLDSSSWWVSLAPAVDRETAIKRAEEMRAQGVAGAFVIREEGENRNAVSLGLFRTEESAVDFQRKLEGKGVVGARVSARLVPGARRAIDLNGPPERVSELVELALAANTAAKRAQCAER